MARRFRVSDTGADIKALRETEVLLGKFSHMSTIGFGICDLQLRYRCINGPLALSNGISIKDHIGRTVEEVLGETALLVEPHFHTVAKTGESRSTEISGRVPGKEGVRHWLACYFPVTTSSKRVKTMAALAIEITEMKKLDRLLSDCNLEMLHRKYRDDARLAIEAHAAMRQYFTALSTSFGKLTRHKWLLDTAADEQLMPVVSALDKRIELMRTLVSEVAYRLSNENKAE